MADEQTTTQTEAPATNTEAARTTDGTLKDQTTTTTTTQTDDSTSTSKATDGTSLLNQGDDTTKTEKTEDKKDAKTGTPEKYEAFKAPDGYEYTPESIEEVSSLFKELGLSQEQGQKLMDVYAKKSLEAANAPYEAYKTLREGWQKQVVANPELGDGVKVKAEVKATIGKALDSLNDPALATSFKEAMDLTGAGDHPAFVAAFYKLAQAVVEGGHVAGNGPSKHGQTSTGKAERPSLAEAMYPRTAS